MQKQNKTPKQKKPMHATQLVTCKASIISLSSSTLFLSAAALVAAAVVPIDCLRMSTSYRSSSAIARRIVSNIDIWPAGYIIACDCMWLSLSNIDIWPAGYVWYYDNHCPKSISDQWDRKQGSGLGSPFTVKKRISSPTANLEYSRRCEWAEYGDVVINHSRLRQREPPKKAARPRSP